jgi:predicted dehydrogenase
MATVSIIGTGFVADLYMRSLETFPDIKILKVYDQDASRLKAFAEFWKVVPATSLEDVLATHQAPEQAPDLILNLTNPGSHYEVSKACLEANRNVYSEKPLAISMEDAHDLHAIAKQKKLVLTSAPCSYLSEVAQTLWKAVRDKVVGQALLVYAELDDDYITQAPYQKWMSESGAPWPFKDEFLVGCTLEHAGYYLTWMMMMFGTVKKVVAASAELIKHKLPDLPNGAPDYSTASLFFENGVVARITCGIIAPHNHSLRVIGEKGVIEVNESWNNSAKVKVRKRYVVRRKLINSPFASRFKLSGLTHPKVPRRGAAAMNFALGPAEVLAAIQDGRDKQYLADFALHLNEVTLAIQNALDTEGVQVMKTQCPSLTPQAWAQ